MNAQSQKTYQKSFKVDERTKLEFITDNVDVTFKVWDKNEVKIDFSMEFKNYSKKEVKEISNKVNIEASQRGNLDDSNRLQIKSSSKKSIARLSYEIEDGHFYFTNLDFNSSKENSHKTLNEIQALLEKKETGFDDFEGYLVFKNDSVAVKNLANASHKGIKSIRSNYVIYLPKYLEMSIHSSRANFILEGEYTGLIYGSFRHGSLTANKLSHPYNSINFLSGDVKIRYISSGLYNFKNVTKGIIGQIKNASIGTEFSKFQIGEIIENTEFFDFKSDLTIYNLGKNFTSIKMKCEYSDIKLFLDKEDDLYMEAIGHNAIMREGEMKIGLQPNREGKKYKMFTRGTKETTSNTFMLDLVHGFITLNYIN